ncbi:MAG: hypothetical protein JKY37_02815 [Nannocystaceae bacterium]|nr:hypothetical protein [Nannocystaceae bacterium]
MGAQSCLPDGSGFEVCMCGDVQATDGGETEGATEESGDAGMDMGADSTDGGDTCGNATEDPGECDETDPAYCPQDCEGGTGDSGSTGSEAACDPTTLHLTGQPIYLSMVPNMGSLWELGGAEGYGAGSMMCVAAGADHVCDYEEIVAAAAQNDFVGVANGTTAWLHRTVPAMDANGNLLSPGIGGRCLDWTYATNHISDGEYVTFNGGVPAFTLDNDTNFNEAAPAPNPHVQVGLLECGGTIRAIPCCVAECTPEV